MLKTVSSVANALGALNYQGTWNASTNTPTLASGVGAQGDYYVVSVDGATNLDGITNWGVGDWAAFNGSVWQRVEGGADGNFVNLDVSGNGKFGTIDVFSNGIKANSNAAIGFQLGDDSTGSTDIGKIVNSSGRFTIEPASTRKFAVRTNSPKVDSLVIDHNSNVEISTGNVVIATSGKGIDFSATAGSGTSEVLDDYEEGVFTVTTNGDASGAFSAETGEYTKIGNVVYIKITFRVSANFASNKIGGLPFTPSYDAGASGKTMVGTLLTSSSSSAPIAGGAVNGADYIEFFASNSTASTFAPNTANDYHRLQGFYYTA